RARARAASARDRADVGYLARSAIETRNVATAEHDIGIQRIGRSVAVLIDTNGQPVSIGDRAVVATARNTNRTALLLSAAQPVRKCVVSSDVVELRSGLVVPRAPGLATIQRDNCALICDEQHDVRLVRIDP